MHSPSLAAPKTSQRCWIEPGWIIQPNLRMGRSITTKAGWARKFWPIIAIQTLGSNRVGRQENAIGSIRPDKLLLRTCLSRFLWGGRK